MLQWGDGVSFLLLLGVILSLPLGWSVPVCVFGFICSEGSDFRATGAVWLLTTQRDSSFLGTVCNCVVSSPPAGRLSRGFDDVLSVLTTALHCNCTNCEKTGYECETDGACMVSTYYVNGKEQHMRVCLNRDSLVPPGKPFFCRSAEGLLNTHCCYDDYCNSIDLKIPGKAPSPHTPTAVPLQPPHMCICIFLLPLH